VYADQQLSIASSSITATNPSRAIKNPLLIEGSSELFAGFSAPAVFIFFCISKTRPIVSIGTSPRRERIKKSLIFNFEFIARFAF
jgi:hypothetical protein